MLTSPTLRPWMPAVLATLLSLGLLVPLSPAMAHAERQSFFPQDRIHQAPHPSRVLNLKGQPQYRALLPTPASPRLVVCKKPGNEGVGAGQDSASRITRFASGALKSVNQQLLGECAFEHLQAAVDAVTLRGTTIYVLPGIYFEQPSIRALDQRAGASTPADTTFCQAVLARGAGALSYEEQFRCRHIQNTVAIFGDPDFTDDNCGDDIEGVCTNPQTHACNPATSACPHYDLQIEGTGEHDYDVIFEGDFADNGQFRYLNGIRGDRADGLYLRNFTTQIFEFNSVYVEETDGFVFDRLLSRYVDEYSFLSFASDHGLYDYTGGYGVADSVQYPGSGADIYKNARHADADLRARQGTEIRNSYAHHGVAGYSGTAGNAGWVHDNRFYKLMVGMVTESVNGGHPGMPQDHTLWENNLIYSNNKDYFRFVNDNGPCNVMTPRDRGVVPPEYREFDGLPPEVQEAILDRIVVCPPLAFGKGTALLIAGGNYDVAQNNIVFDNWNNTFQLLHAPAAIRASSPAQSDPANPFDNSHFNRFLNNRLAENTLTTPHRLQPNGVDFWFDNSGVGNCWDGNTSLAPGGVTADTGSPVQTLPGGPCPDGPLPNTAEQIAAENPARIAFLVNCLDYDRNDPSTKSPTCPFFDPIVAPAGREGETTALATQPTQAQALAGQTVKSGYFVLNNDTGENHTVSVVTVAAQGALARLSGLKLTVITQTDTERKTASVSLNQVAGSNVFTFTEPVTMERVNHVLFELEATAASTSTARSAAALMLAGGAGSGVLGLLLMLGGMSRRRALPLVALALAASLLAACHSSDRVDGDAAATAGEKVSFKLTALEVSNGGAAVSYAGLPLTMGSVELR